MEVPILEYASAKKSTVIQRILQHKKKGLAALVAVALFAGTNRDTYEKTLGHYTANDINKTIPLWELSMNNQSISLSGAAYSDNHTAWTGGTWVSKYGKIGGLVTKNKYANADRPTAWDTVFYKEISLKK